MHTTIPILIGINSIAMLAFSPMQLISILLFIFAFSTVQAASAASATNSLANSQAEASTLTQTEAPTSDYLSSIKARAEKQNIAQDIRWLRIGHYRSNHFGGFRSEFDDPDFFLSKKGKTDPTAELMATLDALAQPLTANVDKKGSETHAQCRYLSRRRYLNEVLNIDTNQWPQHTCPYNTNWKKKLDPEAISLVFASAYLNNAASMFGHTFLKFHSRSNSKEQDLLNYGVSFAAHTGQDGGMAFAVRGLFGGYQGFYSLLPYHQTLKEYANLEGRDIFEYRLKLSAEEIQILLDHLIEIQSARVDYYFFDENCAYQLLTLLEVAKPSLDVSQKFIYQVIPADTVRVLSREPGLFSEIIYRPSLETKFQASLKNLTYAQTKLSKSLVLASASSSASSSTDATEGPTTHQPTNSWVDAQQLLSSYSPEEQVSILDASLTYANLLSEKQPETLKDRNHQLKVLRAKTGISGHELSIPPPPRPEQGHDSAIIGFEVGTFNSHNFLQSQFRPAYHHALSRDDGYLNDTHLELGRLTVRQYFNPDRMIIQEFLVNEIISSSPANLFFQPMAWRAEIGWKHLEDKSYLSSIGPSVSGGVGYAIQPFRSRLLLAQTFLQGVADSNADLENRYRLGASSNLALVSHISKIFTARAGFEYRQYFVGEFVTVPKISLDTNLNLSRNIELRASAARVRDLYHWQGGAYAHFLF